LLTFAACVFAASGATAGIIVYHNEGATGGFPILPAPFFPQGSTDVLELYVVKDEGTAGTTGIRCVNGDGGETCGVHLRIGAFGGMVFTSFDTILAQPLLPSDEIRFIKIPPTGDFTELRINATHTVWAPSEEIPIHLGSLGVRKPSNPTESSIVSVISGHHVDARGTLSNISPQTIAVPEAPRLVMLLCGLALLCVLERARARSVSARGCP
jgi:hypothetical protein